MRSIKTKFIIAISLLIIGLLAVSAILLIKEKEKELTGDIYIQSRAFADLSSDRITKIYEEFLSKEAFIPFKKELVKIITSHPDLKDFSIVSFEGEILYNLNQEKDQRSNTTDRKIIDANLLERIKASNISVQKASDLTTIYLKKDENGLFQTLDINEREIKDVPSDLKITNVVAPVNNKYAVIYDISYQNLEFRLKQMRERIFLLAIFGVMIGLILSYDLAYRITEPIKRLNQGVLTIAKGDFKERVALKSKDEVGQLAISFNKMAQDLENSTKALIYKERVAKELELAAKIQKELLPKEVPRIKGLQIAAGLLPAAEIGGDCFDFIQTNPDCLISYIGDVTGHGVPSGLVVAVANAIIYSFASSTDIVKIMTDANKIIKAKSGPNMFLTMLMTKWDLKKEIFSYVIAGHDPILLYKAKENKVYQLKEGGMALGMLPDISKLLKLEEIHLEKDDTVILYTDGIPEAWANPKEYYGMSRLKRAVNEFASLKTAEDIKKAILQDVKSFMGNFEQKDDITLMVFKKE